MLNLYHFCSGSTNVSYKVEVYGLYAGVIGFEFPKEHRLKSLRSSCALSEPVQANKRKYLTAFPSTSFPMHCLLIVPYYTLLYYAIVFSTTPYII